MRPILAGTLNGIYRTQVGLHKSLSPPPSRARNLTIILPDCQIMERVDQRLTVVLDSKNGKLSKLQDALDEAYEDGTIDMKERRDQLYSLVTEVRKSVESVKSASSAVVSSTKRDADVDDVATMRIIRLESMAGSTYEKASAHCTFQEKLYNKIMSKDDWSPETKLHKFAKLLKMDRDRLIKEINAQHVADGKEKAAFARKLDESAERRVAPKVSAGRAAPGGRGRGHGSLDSDSGSGDGSGSGSDEE